MTDLNIDHAIEAAAKAYQSHWYTETKNLGYYRTEVTCACGETLWWGDHEGDPHHREVWDQQHLAGAAITAALPHIRAALADEIEAHCLPLNKPLNPTYNDGMEYAAIIVRGEDS